MNIRRTLVVLAFVILLSIPSGRGAAQIRDGSSFERAILVEGDYEHSVDWEWAYLKKHFGGRMPKEQGLTQHKGRTYDRFVFSDRVVYFDVTRFAGQIFKKRTKSLAELMKEMGIPAANHQ